MNHEKNSAQFLNELIEKEIEDSAPALIPVDHYLEENCHAEIEYSHDRSCKVIYMKHIISYMICVIRVHTLDTRRPS